MKEEKRTATSKPDLAIAPPSDPVPSSAPSASVEVNAVGQPLGAGWLRAVAIIWCGQAASVLATVAASFSCMWYLTETTGSPLWLALAGVATFLPAGLLSPFGGVAADRFRRKRVMVAADGLAGLFSLGLALVVMLGEVSVPVLMALLAARSAAQAFHGPALSAFVPQLVPERHLVRINTLDQMITSVSSMVGPALGIFLYATFGFQAVLLADAALAAVACACLVIARTPAHVPSADATRGVVSDLDEGVRLVRGDGGLRGLMAMTVTAMMIFAPLGTLYPLMTYGVFGGTGYDASVVEAVSGLGLMVGSVVVFAWGGGRRPVRLIVASATVMAAAVAACGLLQPGQFWLFALLTGVVGCAMGAYNAPVLPLMQMRVSPDSIGRVMGLFMTGTTLATPLGLLVAGPAAQALGVQPWFLVTAVLLAVTQLAIGTRPAIRALEEPFRAMGGRDADEAAAPDAPTE